MKIRCKVEVTRIFIVEVEGELDETELDNLNDLTRDKVFGEVDKKMVQAREDSYGCGFLDWEYDTLNAEAVND